MSNDEWLAEPITYRRFLLEELLADGADSWQALEAIASTALDRPEVDWEETHPRGYWEDPSAYSPAP